MKFSHFFFSRHYNIVRLKMKQTKRILYRVVFWKMSSWCGFLFLNISNILLWQQHPLHVERATGDANDIFLTLEIAWQVTHVLHVQQQWCSAIYISTVLLLGRLYIHISFDSFILLVVCPLISFQMISSSFSMKHCENYIIYTGVSGYRPTTYTRTIILFYVCVLFTSSFKRR